MSHVSDSDLISDYAKKADDSVGEKEPTEIVMLNESLNPDLAKFVREKNEHYEGNTAYAGNVCNCCNKRFSFDITKAMADLSVAITCPRCVSAGITDRMNYLNKVFPEMDPPTDIDHEEFNRKWYDKLIKTVKLSNVKGVWLYGVSGACKSRIIRELAIKLLQDNPDAKFTILYGSQIAPILRAGYQEDEPDKLKNMLLRSDLIVLDDLGFEALSTQILIDFFGAIDAVYRSRDKGKFLIGSNFSPETLEIALPKTGNDADIERSRSIIRRLRDMCWTREIYKVKSV